MKPGIKTTEFWLTLLGLIGGIGSLGYVLYANSHEIWEYVAGGGAFILSIIKSIWYNKGRVLEKIGAEQSVVHPNIEIHIYNNKDDNYI